VHRRFLIVSVAAIALLAQGCSGLVRKEAVPQSLTSQAEIPGLPGVRYRPTDIDAMAREGLESVGRERRYLASKGHKGPLPPAVFLAVSGGGDSGAFGAGLLNGWTTAGNRPQFKLVTGISTGALIAPFAFLGPKYDARLEDFYTNTAPQDIVEPRWLISAVFSDALADNRPLWRRVAKEIDRALLDEIAAEYEKGRLLLIGTTDLDARQGVIWNMTKIASSRDPRALELFRAVMVTSAAIPGAFPPTMIDVEAGGKAFQEMHVDGGAVAQVFLYPPTLDVRAKQVSGKLVEARERVAYIIRNARVDPEWAEVERRTLSISSRAISSLINTQGIGDLYRIYATTQRDKVDFNLAYISKAFDAPHPREFDTEYMRELFSFAYVQAVGGYPWQKLPPGLAAGDLTTKQN
jgi:predicted acylesterase/phospholipase RssA